MHEPATGIVLARRDLDPALKNVTRFDVPGADGNGVVFYKMSRSSAVQRSVRAGMGICTDEIVQAAARNIALDADTAIPDDQKEWIQDSDRVHQRVHRLVMGEPEDDDRPMAGLRHMNVHDVRVETEYIGTNAGTPPNRAMLPTSYDPEVTAWWSYQQDCVVVRYGSVDTDIHIKLEFLRAPDTAHAVRHVAVSSCGTTLVVLAAGVGYVYRIGMGEGTNTTHVASKDRQLTFLCLLDATCMFRGDELHHLSVVVPKRVKLQTIGGETQASRVVDVESDVVYVTATLNNTIYSWIANDGIYAPVPKVNPLPAVTIPGESVVGGSVSTVYMGRGVVLWSAVCIQEMTKEPCVRVVPLYCNESPRTAINTRAKLWSCSFRPGWSFALEAPGEACTSGATTTLVPIRFLRRQGERFFCACVVAWGSGICLMWVDQTGFRPSTVGSCMLSTEYLEYQSASRVVSGAAATAMAWRSKAAPLGASKPDAVEVSSLCGTIVHAEGTIVTFYRAVSGPFRIVMHTITPPELVRALSKAENQLERACITQARARDCEYGIPHVINVSGVEPGGSMDMGVVLADHRGTDISLWMCNNTAVQEHDRATKHGLLPVPRLNNALENQGLARGATEGVIVPKRCMAFLLDARFHTDTIQCNISIDLDLNPLLRVAKTPADVLSIAAGVAERSGIPLPSESVLYTMSRTLSPPDPTGISRDAMNKKQRSMASTVTCLARMHNTPVAVVPMHILGVGPTPKDELLLNSIHSAFGFNCSINKAPWKLRETNHVPFVMCSAVPSAFVYIWKAFPLRTRHAQQSYTYTDNDARSSLPLSIFNSSTAETNKLDGIHGAISRRDILKALVDPFNTVVRKTTREAAQPAGRTVKERDIIAANNQATFNKLFVEHFKRWWGEMGAETRRAIIQVAVSMSGVSMCIQNPATKVGRAGGPTYKWTTVAKNMNALLEGADKKGLSIAYVMDGWFKIERGLDDGSWDAVFMDTTEGIPQPRSGRASSLQVRQAVKNSKCTVVAGGGPPILLGGTQFRQLQDAVVRTNATTANSIICKRAMLLPSTFAPTTKILSTRFMDNRSILPAWRPPVSLASAPFAHMTAHERCNRLRSGLRAPPLVRGSMHFARAISRGFTAALTSFPEIRATATLPTRQHAGHAQDIVTLVASPVRMESPGMGISERIAYRRRLQFPPADPTAPAAGDDDGNGEIAYV